MVFEIFKVGRTVWAEMSGEFKLQVHHMKLQKRLLAESDS